MCTNDLRLFGGYYSTGHLGPDLNDGYFNFVLKFV